MFLLSEDTRLEKNTARMKRPYGDKKTLVKNEGFSLFFLQGFVSMFFIFVWKKCEVWEKKSSSKAIFFKGGEDKQLSWLRRLLNDILH